MVEDNASPVTRPGGIGTVVDVLLLTTTATDKTHHDVIAVIPQRVIAQGNAGGGSRLAENGGVGTDADVALQGDDTTHIEDHNLLVAATDGLSEGTVAGIVQIRDMNDLAITSTGDVTAVALGTGEGWRLCLGRHRQSGDGQHRC